VTLRTVEFDNGYREPILTECPFCGYEFADHEDRGEHFAEQHGPEDAGLSPLGETDAAAQEPMFTPFEELPMPPEAEQPTPQEAPAERIEVPRGGRSDD
jgi:hypothetical protein